MSLLHPLCQTEVCTELCEIISTLHIIYFIFYHKFGFPQNYPQSLSKYSFPKSKSLFSEFSCFRPNIHGIFHGEGLPLAPPPPHGATDTNRGLFLKVRTGDLQHLAKKNMYITIFGRNYPFQGKFITLVHFWV